LEVTQLFRGKNHNFRQNSQK